MTQETSIQAYKAFNSDWTCRGFKYTVGETYDHKGKVDVCKTGFHACTNPLEVFQHYVPTGKFAAVELSGEISKSTDGDTKIASAKIMIKAEISLYDFIGRAVAWLMDNATEKTQHATGYRSAASATGYQSAASADHKSSSAFAPGRFGVVSGVTGSALHLNEWDAAGQNIIHVWAGIVGRDGVKEGQKYTLTDGTMTKVSA